MTINVISIIKKCNRSFFAMLIYVFLVLIIIPIIIIVSVSNSNAVSVVKRNTEISLETITKQAYNGFLSIIDSVDEISLQIISSDLVRDYCVNAESSDADIQLKKDKIHEYLSGLKYGNKYINRISLFSLTQDSYRLDLGMDDSINSFGLLSGEERKEFIESDFIKGIIDDNGEFSFHVDSHNPDYDEVGRLYFTRLLKDINTGENLMIISIYFSDYEITNFLDSLDLEDREGFTILTVENKYAIVSDGTKYVLEEGAFDEEFDLEKGTFELDKTDNLSFMGVNENLLVSYLTNEKHNFRLMSFLPVRNLTKSLDETLPFIILITFLVIILAIFSGVLFSFYLKRRIDSINSQLSKIKEGFFDVEFEFIKDDEIGMIEEGIVSMSRKLYTNTEELEAGYEELVVMNQELMSLNDQIEASNKTKDHFLMNISHELRTPMNAIIGMTKLVLRTDLSSEQKDYLKMIETSSANLMVIIDELLDLTKIENGEMELVNREFSIKTLYKEIIKVFNLGINKTTIKFSHYISDTIPEILIGDAGKIKQIVSNLIGNAIKFTKKGEIRFDIIDDGTEGEKENIRIIISDTGIGIEESKKDMIFKKFTQGDSSLTRQYGGTGVGLYIVKELVELMGGTIEFESTLDKGTTFTVNMQLKIAGY